jgi:diguanylate cyclase (GGDEF)-like protein
MLTFCPLSWGWTEYLHHDNFENEAEGSITFAAGEAEETLCYVSIQGTGWVMAVLIRESVIQDQIWDINEKSLMASRNQVIFTLVSVLLLATVLLLQYRKFSKDKLEEEKETSRAFQNMANTDSLTGVRNKHAYSGYETAVNQQIQAGELEKLAVVVGDINGLKYVNDTQGHAAGDQLIKDACALICEYFTHGAVFRVGGDEFVVLLQGKGYDTVHEVIGELNRKIEENIKKDAVVISIGYSLLNQGDQQLRDVFERADQMMYERKKELKSMGARTSRQ